MKRWSRGLQHPRNGGLHEYRALQRPVRLPLAWTPYRPAVRSPCNGLRGAGLIDHPIRFGDAMVSRLLPRTSPIEGASEPFWPTVFAGGAHPLRSIRHWCQWHMSRVWNWPAYDPRAAVGMGLALGDIPTEEPAICAPTPARNDAFDERPRRGSMGWRRQSGGRHGRSGCRCPRAGLWCSATSSASTGRRSHSHAQQRRHRAGTSTPTRGWVHAFGISFVFFNLREGWTEERR